MSSSVDENLASTETNNDIEEIVNDFIRNFLDFFETNATAAYTFFSDKILNGKICKINDDNDESDGQLVKAWENVRLIFERIKNKSEQKDIPQELKTFLGNNDLVQILDRKIKLAKRRLNKLRMGHSKDDLSTSSNDYPADLLDIQDQINAMLDKVQNNSIHVFEAKDASKKRPHQIYPPQQSTSYPDLML